MANCPSTHQTAAGVTEMGSDDIQDFMDKERLQTARAKVDQWRQQGGAVDDWKRSDGLAVSPAEQADIAAALLDKFERAILKLDKVNNFLASNSSSAEKMITEMEVEVEETMKQILALVPRCIKLGADDVSLFLDEKRLADMIEAAEGEDWTRPKRLGQSDALGMDARMLDLALCPFERNKYLSQLKQAGLLCITRTCRAETDHKDLLTLITAPNDRFEFEAEKQRLEKRLLSQNTNSKRPAMPYAVLASCHLRHTQKKQSVGLSQGPENQVLQRDCRRSLSVRAIFRVAVTRHGDDWLCFFALGA